MEKPHFWQRRPEMGHPDRFATFRWIAGLGLVALAGFCSCSTRTQTKIELSDPPEQRATTMRATAAPAQLRCPQAGAPMLQPSENTGHHRVTLTWNASAPSARKEDDAVGYCLYRSPTQGAAKKNPTCNACEQINTIPVAGTACIDDLVQDGANYFYVAIAINAAGKTSVASNEVPAQVPADPNSTGTPPNYPLCRAPGGPQNTSNAVTGGASRR